METLERLNNFLDQVLSDKRLRAVHIGIYGVLCYSWMIGGFKNPFNISRRKIMQMSKVKSKATYHKSIRDLIAAGHIRYLPSYHPAKGTSVTLVEKFPDNKPSEECKYD